MFFLNTKMNLFKIKIVVFSILFLRISDNDLQAQINYAKDARLNSLFNNNEQLFEVIENRAIEILKSGNYLKIEEARNQLIHNAYKKVKIKAVKPYTKILTPQEIAKKIKKSTLIVGDAYLCGSCSDMHISPASGYVIDEDGIFVTNHHVVENYSKGTVIGQKKLSMQIMTSDGKVYPVTEILSCSKEADLAIVKAEVGTDKLIPIPLGDTAELGSEVYVLSNPSSMFYFYSKGIVSRNYLKPINKESEILYPETDITADYAAGSSGAPVVNNKGNLISTVSTTRSIYYRPQMMADLQMVIKGTKPVILLKDLLELN